MGVYRPGKWSLGAVGTMVSDTPAHDYKWLLEQEANTWKHPIALPIRRRLWLLRHGFTSPGGKLYDFESFDRSAYLSELQRYRLYRACNGQYRYLIDDKLSQHRMMADYPENRPTAYGIIDRGYIHGVTGTELDDDPVRIKDWFPAMVKQESALVMKHLRGMGGKQVRVCTYDDEYFLDGESVSVDMLTDEIAQLSGYLVTDYIDQHGYAAQLYPNAANTIRLLTLWDDVNDVLHTPIAIHRIGTHRSQPVDNWSSGGVSAEIDLETGELGSAAQFPFTGEVPWYSTHPDTGSQIAGTTVPDWDEVRSTIERIARDNTHIPAIGWDVIMNQSLDPIIIEANTGTDIDLFQVHRPLLADTRVAGFVSNYLPEVKSHPRHVSRPPRV